MRRTALTAAVIVAVLARVAIAFAAWRGGGVDVFMTPDSQNFVASASALVDRSRFDDPKGNPEIFRTPGYPLLLAVGHRTGNPIAFTLAVQFALAAAVVVLTAGFIAGIAGPRWGVAGAFVAALEPVLLLWSVKIMAETLLVFFIVVFLWCAWRAMETRDARWLIGAAVAISLAAYAKPVAYPLALMTCIAAFLPWGEPARGTLRRGGIVLATCAVLLVPWHVRNARVAGYAGFSSLTDYALYVSAGGSVEARREGQAYADVRTRLLSRASAAPRPPYAEMRREGWAQLRSDPAGYAAVHAQGMFRTLFDPGAIEYLRLFGRYEGAKGALMRAVDLGPLRAFLVLAREQPQVLWPTVLLAGLLAPLVLLPLFAIRGLAPEARRPFALLAAVAAYFVIVGGGVPGSNRFRVPAIPPLIIMSAVAVRRALLGGTFDVPVILSRGDGEGPPATCAGVPNRRGSFAALRRLQDDSGFCRAGSQAARPAALIAAPCGTSFATSPSRLRSAQRAWPLCVSAAKAPRLRA